ncbi:MAG: twin-arginine translocation signal domain-containing protein [Cyclobacteriaceae bacterium]|nr:twin-arginine translocation signal domain-containing protein [Cyclobacteriaceae bacterium]
MNLHNRRKFLKLSTTTAISMAFTFPGRSFSPVMEDTWINTVTGKVKVRKLGKCLIHEHILVDFIGADKTSYQRWDRDAVVKQVLPYLIELKKSGFQTLFDCTPAYLGRDPWLLKEISEKSGIYIITNTGYYGAVNNKYIPQHAFSETAEELADRWIDEYNNGIENSEVRPGFIKISVNPASLSGFHQKLVTAAGLVHLATGMAIASHTGPYIPARDQLNVLEKMGVSPDAFIWVHAQNEKDPEYYKKVGNAGGWISIEGIREGNFEEYISKIIYLKENGLLKRTLISHDAGWYDPDKPDSTDFAPFTVIPQKMIPALKEKGFTNKEIDQLFVKNPIEAFSPKLKKE